MNTINLVEGKLVAPEGMKVGIIASRFNEIIVNKLFQSFVAEYDIRRHVLFIRGIFSPFPYFFVQLL